MLVHAATTQSIALDEMASELVGSQRQARSVASHPTCPAAVLTQGRCSRCQYLDIPLLGDGFVLQHSLGTEW
jgi:hypothetical protein